MEMRGREDIRIGEELTPPLSPLAASLYHSALSSHCSACFSPLPNISTLTLSYCSPTCSALDSPLHLSSAESHLLLLSPPDSADLRLSLRLLHHALEHNLTVDCDLERIGGLMTNRDKLLSTGEDCLSQFVPEDDDDDDDDDVLGRIRSGAKAMAAARRMMSRGDSEEDERELVLCTAVLCLVMTNAVEVQDRSGRGIGVAVYDATFSWINHSCSPNACYHFSTRSEEGGEGGGGPWRLRIFPASVDGSGETVETCPAKLGRGRYGPRMILRSIKPIRKGEEVTIAYTDLLQPKASRQSELWLKHRFVCFCNRCAAVPLTSVDLNLQEVIASDHNYHRQETIRKLRDYYGDAIAEYLSFSNAQSCCAKLENLLIRGQADHQPGVNVILHPFHHISLNAYMILASAYKVQANDLLDPNSETEQHYTEAFNLMRVSVAYSLMLAGATHHLFCSEASLIIFVAHFWVSAGESLLHFASSQIWDKRPITTVSRSFSSYTCRNCSLLDRFRASRAPKHDQGTQCDNTTSHSLDCIIDITTKLWNSLTHGGCYLQVVKHPIDFTWLATINPRVMFYSETQHGSPRVENSVERADLVELGIHCLLYGELLSCVCYGQNSHMICNVEDTLRSNGILVTY